MIVGSNALLNQYVPTFYIKNIKDGQGLIYDNVRKAYVNADLNIVGGAERLGELLDVSPTVDNPLSLHNGQSLTYNSFTNLWENSFTDYNTLLNKPTSSSFSFAGLSDTAKPSLPDGYVKWNSAGTQLVYSTTIPVANITGLALVAKTGDYNDLINKPPAGGSVTSVDVSGGTTGLTTIGGPVTTAGIITLGGLLSVANGGTGQVTATNAFNALAPNQIGHAGMFLTTNGTLVSWATIPAGAGTVTSVGAVGNNGIIVTGSPITTNGVINIDLGNITPTSVAATSTITGSNLSGTNTGDQTITLTGDVTGTGTGSFATILATVNLNPGIFGDSSNVPVVTVNNKGLVTSIDIQPIDVTVSDLLPEDGSTTETFTIKTRHQYIVTGRLEIVGHVINNGRIAVL